MSSFFTGVELIAGAVGAASSVLSMPAQVKIGGITVQVSIEEDYEHSIQITEQPVEKGADITDHAFVMPSRLTLRCGWSNSGSGASAASGLVQGALGQIPGVSAIAGAPKFATASSFFAGGSTTTAAGFVGGVYSQLIALQQSLQPFTVQTGLRSYDNMLIKSLRVTRDEKTSQALMVVATLQQIIIVSTQSTILPGQSAQLNPQDTASVVNTGTAALVRATPSPGGSVPPSSWAATMVPELVTGIQGLQQ